MEEKYCVFMDVLGYKSLVMDEELDDDQKLKKLHSIYSSLATHFLYVINQVNNLPQTVHPLYLRSFSDCFYLDCTDIWPLLTAIEDIFSNTIGFYSNFTPQEQYTPLLRCGIVKDKVAKFRDISSLTNGDGIELNPVGKGVARAYLTSEKSILSGMRIIISPEVFNDLEADTVSLTDYPCYKKMIKTYGIEVPYFFKRISQNEAGNDCDLYEMLWPYSRVRDSAYECIDILTKLQPTFTGEAMRHFVQTAKLFQNAHQLSDWRKRDPYIFNRDHRHLQQLATL